MLTITAKRDTTLPIDVSRITDCRLSQKTPEEIADLPISVGRHARRLADEFEISGQAEESIHWRVGANVHGIGTANQSSQVHIQGGGGQRIGFQMQGGSISIDGNAGALLGSQMRGGVIEVDGNAGDRVGGAAHPNEKGQRGGTILVRGSVGQDAGYRMRRGLLVVAGSAEHTVARGMLAGTIFVYGQLGARAGEGMRRGTLITCDSNYQPPAGFAPACEAMPLALRMLLRKLESMQVTIPAATVSATVYNGDLLEGGRGELFVL